MCQINSQALGQSGQVCGCAVPTAWPQHRHKPRLWLLTEPPPGHTALSAATAHPELGQGSGEESSPHHKGWLPPAQVLGKQSSSLLSHPEVLRLLLVTVFPRVLGIASAGIFDLPLFHFLCFLPKSHMIRHSDVKQGNLNCFFLSLASMGRSAASSCTYYILYKSIESNLK